MEIRDRIVEAVAGPGGRAERALSAAALIRGATVGRWVGIYTVTD
jgi:hypothetical protein